ncbi:MAG: type II/IV secretion system protein [Planctomycetes bacterium]|nr:type II/IV secretion system protein [Planctomycetota bacterium]
MDLSEKDNLTESNAMVTEPDSEQTVLVKDSPRSDEDAARVLAQKHGVEFVTLSETKLSAQVVQIIPQWLVTRHNIIAVKFEEDTLYVAMTNPVDLPTLDQINLVTSFNVKPVVATERDIIQAIGQHYGAEQMTKQDLADVRVDTEPALDVDKEAEDLMVSDEASQVVRLVNSVIRNAIDSRASDIHFEPVGEEMVVRLRVDGILHDCLTVPAAVKKEVISRLKVLAQMDITEKRKAQDGNISLNYKGNNYDLRVSVLSTTSGEKTVLRVLDKNSMLIDLATLGVRAEERALIEGAISRPYGMVLVTGPTGSGKSTSLYAMLRSLDAIEKNIITVENPVEYQLDRINQIQIDPVAGESFAGVLRSILRQDPDIIMVGEIRDLETAEIAVQAALTGHLVLSTLHTNDAPTAITRLRELGIPSFLISSCIIMAGAQRLVRKICTDCKEPYQPDEEILRLLEIDETPDGGFVHGKGCNYCYGTGFRGREGVFELLEINSDIQNAISSDKSALEIKKMAVDKGMKTLLDLAIIKVSEGKTTAEEVKRVIASERFQ